MAGGHSIEIPFAAFQRHFDGGGCLALCRDVLCYLRYARAFLRFHFCS